MLPFYKRYWRTAFDIALIGVTVYLFMWLFSYLYNLVTPIFLALIIFLIIEPFARFLNRRGIKKSIASAISVLLFTLIIVGSLVGMGILFYLQMDKISENMPRYMEMLQHNLVDQTATLQAKYDALPDDITDRVNEYASKLSQYGGTFATWMIGLLIGWLGSFSTFLVNFAIALILAYFLSVEIDTWRKLANNKTPKTFKSAYRFLKDNVLIGIGGYLKAQMKLISITFAIIFIGLLVIGADKAFSIAILSAILDLLPLLGVPVVFFPWIIYSFIVGNTTLAIQLIVIYAIAAVVRQLAEPKITGDTLGVSAFTMLSFMILSLSLFGVAGLILAPILIILVKALYEQGYFKRWIRLPEGEYSEEPQEFNMEYALAKSKEGKTQ